MELSGGVGMLHLPKWTDPVWLLNRKDTCPTGHLWEMQDWGSLLQVIATPQTHLGWAVGLRGSRLAS